MELIQSMTGHTKRLLECANELHSARGSSGGEAEPSAQQRAAIATALKGACSDMAHIRSAGLPFDRSAMVRLLRLLSPLISRPAEETSPQAGILWRLEPAYMQALRRVTKAAAHRGPLLTSEARAMQAIAPAVDAVAPMGRATGERVVSGRGHLSALEMPSGRAGEANLNILAQVAQMAAPLPTELLLPEALTVTQGFKRKWSKQEYQHLGLQNFTFSKIILNDGRSIVRGSTSGRGSFGKVADAIFSGGPALMVKTVRTEAKAGQDKWGRNKTHAVQQQEVIEEYFTTVKMRGIIDQGIASGHLDDSVESMVVRAMRPVSSPFEGYGVVELASLSKEITLQSHTLMMMSRDAGDLFTLNRRISQNAPDSSKGPLSAALALSVVVQGFDELHYLHTQAKMAHLDLSTGNIFTTVNGQMKVMDFGMAEKLDEAGLTAHTGFFGSIITPEAVARVQPAQERQRLSKATDVFAMSVLAFEVAAAHTGAPNPFHGGGDYLFSDAWLLDSSDYRAFVMDEFVRWRAGHMMPQSSHIVAQSIAEDDASDPFTAFFGPLARELPEVAEALLNGGMALSPNERLESRDMLARLSVAGQIPIQSLLDLWPYYTDPVKEQATVDEIAKLHRADAWAQDKIAREESNAHVPGAPRPLP